MIQKKKKLKRAFFPSLLFSIFWIIALFVFVGFLVFSNWRLYQRRAELVSQITVIQKEINALDKKNQELNAGFSRLTNQNYLEQIAREKLGLKKPGEQVVVVVPPPKTEENPAPMPKSFWQKVIEMLKF